MASSRGRVTVGIIRAAGSSPTSAMTLTIGNVTEGKIAAGERSAATTPAPASTATPRKISGAALAHETGEDHGETATGAPSGSPHLPGGDHARFRREGEAR